MLPCPAVDCELVDPLLLLGDVQIAGEVCGTIFASHLHRGFETISYLLAGAASLGPKNK